MVYLAVMSANGLCYYTGFLKTDFSQSIPFLMLGIGIDDMFVICNALDQSPLTMPPA